MCAQERIRKTEDETGCRGRSWAQDAFNTRTGVCMGAFRDDDAARGEATQQAKGSRRNAWFTTAGGTPLVQGSGVGCTFQISRAYCSIVRSLEKKPLEAVYRMERRVHSSWSRYSLSTSSWASM